MYAVQVRLQRHWRQRRWGERLRAATDARAGWHRSAAGAIVPADPLPGAELPKRSQDRRQRVRHLQLRLIPEG
jgi:hypothetical protein